jgi:hypothetical protein
MPHKTANPGAALSGIAGSGNVHRSPVDDAWSPGAEAGAAQRGKSPKSPYDPEFLDPEFFLGSIIRTLDPDGRCSYLVNGPDYLPIDIFTKRSDAMLALAQAQRVFLCQHFPERSEACA